MSSTDSSSANEGVDDVVPLEKILSSLKIMADNIQNEPSEIKKQLERRGYKFSADPDERQLQMSKALTVAVIEAIQEKVEVVKQEKVLIGELFQLLVFPGHPSPETYFYRDFLSATKRMTSPLDLAKLLKSNAPQWLVQKIIERQFDIKWDTPDGEPADFTFYDICDMKNTKKCFAYSPRRAHVEATLYKGCCRKLDKLKKMHDLLRKPENALCPEVYVKADGVFKKWQAYGEEHEEGRFRNDVPIDLSWINESIFKFIRENSDAQKSDDESLKQCLQNPTVYWLVIDDADFMEGEELKLKSIGRTQVYVGKSNNGVKGRWLTDRDSHCKMMMKCLRNVDAMTTYDPLRLKGIQLVDARLALARVRGEKSALFVMKTFGDDLKKAEIARSKAEKCLATLKKNKERLDDISSQGHDSSHELERLKAEKKVEEQRKKLNNAEAVVRDLKKQVEEAEKSHLHGKRVGDSHKNIIPYNEYNMTWTPKDMGYGMNFR